MSIFPSMTKYLAPHLRFGTALVEHFEVPKFSLGPIWYGTDAPEPGTYVRLKELPAADADPDSNRATLWMSDTWFEHRTNSAALHNARGRVLVAGLGIGMVTVAMLQKDGVGSVHVIERNPDIVAAVAGQLANSLPAAHRRRLTVEVADVWSFAAAGRYDAIYFDIWPDLCTDYLEQMTRLGRMFRKHLAPDGWMGFWGREELRYRRQQERRAGW